MGRFTSKDPWLGDLQRPTTLHGWTYAHNNPILLVDRSGLNPIRHTVRVETWNLRFECEDDDPNYPPGLIANIEIGLGTIIGNGFSVLTHDHWKKWRQADYIRFIDYQGTITKVSRKQLDALKRHLGNETLLLVLPPGSLPLGAPALLGNPDNLSPGDRVELVYQHESQRAEEGMYVLPTEVHHIHRYDFGEIEGPIEVAELLDTGWTINQGDSGGGLFRGGALVGNTYAIGQDPSFQFRRVVWVALRPPM